MKLEIDIPYEYYEVIKKSKFRVQEPYLVTLIKEGKIIEEDDKIIEDDIGNFVEIGSLEPGTTIEISNIQMEILDNTSYMDKGDEIGVFCLSKNILFERPFDKDDNNNWEKSSLREYLNVNYIVSLDNELANALIPFDRNLLTNDGMKDYRICTDLISLISEREYQDYREYISDKLDWWWTLTASSAKPSYSYGVQYIRADGSLSSSPAEFGHTGVSPVFLLRPSLKVKIVKKRQIPINKIIDYI